MMGTSRLARRIVVVGALLALSTWLGAVPIGAQDGTGTGNGGAEELLGVAAPGLTVTTVSGEAFGGEAEFSVVLRAVETGAVTAQASVDALRTGGVGSAEGAPGIGRCGRGSCGGAGERRGGPGSRGGAAHDRRWAHQGHRGRSHDRAPTERRPHHDHREPPGHHRGVAGRHRLVAQRGVGHGRRGLLVLPDRPRRGRQGRYRVLR